MFLHEYRDKRLEYKKRKLKTTREKEKHARKNTPRNWAKCPEDITKSTHSHTLHYTTLHTNEE